MANYDDGQGIQIGSKLRNYSANFPLVRLEQNHASGIGWFTSVGDNTNPPDTNVGNATSGTASRYLKNLPPKKRAANYVAILGQVTAQEAIDHPAFAETANPSVYVYKGPQATDGTITDAEWMDNANWVPVGGDLGGGDITLEVNDLQISAAASLLDFQQTNYETTVEWDSVNEQIKIGLQDDIAIGGAGAAFRLGPLADNYMAGGSNVYQGFEALGNGKVLIRTTGGQTTIHGGEYTSTGFIDVDGTIESATHVEVADGSGQYSRMTSDQIKSNIIWGDSMVTTKAIQSVDSSGISFRYAPDPSHWFMRASFGVSADPQGFAFGGPGVSPSWLHFNSNIKFYGIAQTSTSNTNYVYVENTSGSLNKVPLSEIANAGSQDLTSGFGINISGSDVISVDPTVIMTLNTNQQSNSLKRLGNIQLTGNTTTETSNGEGLVFEDGSIQDASTAGYSPSQVNMLYRAFGGTNNGLVVKGPTPTDFLGQHLLAGNDITAVDSSTQITLNVDPVFFRTDRDDKSIYKGRMGRFGAHLFTAGEISSDYYSNHAADADANVLSGLQSDATSSSTVIEWVREGGTYVGDTSVDRQNRRNKGVIMKAGFTAVQDPYFAGIDATKFRFSAKKPGEAEITTQAEELGGVITFPLSAGNYQYNAGWDDFAIQIGTGSDNAAGNRYNEVTIPNLIAGTITSAGPNYFGGGGTLAGDWTVTGDLTVNGVFTATTTSGGTQEVDFSGTLLGLGMPVGTYTGNSGDSSDIGFAGVFTWNDTDTDNVVDDSEAFKTGLFRDASESAVTNVYYVGTNTHKPYKFMTSATAANVPTAEDFRDTDKEWGAPVMAGGISLQGWDLSDTNMSAFTSSGYMNRVTTDIDSAYTHEIGLSDAWHAWDHTSLPTTKAVKEYVDAQIATVTGTQFAMTQETVFNYGMTDGSEVDSTGSNYTYANADSILMKPAGSNDVKYITAEELGLAIDFDSVQTGRPAVGFMPGSAIVKEGTSLRAIMKKILVNFVKPTISLDATEELDDLALDGASYKLSGNVYVETGFNRYGDPNSPGDTISVKITDYAGANAWQVSTSFSGVTVTDTNDSSSIAADTVLLGNNATILSPGIQTSATPSGTNNVNLDIELDFTLDNATADDDLNGIGYANVKFDIESGTAEGSVTYQAKINSFTDNAYYAGSPNVTSSKYVYVRRRSFYFVSDFNARAWLASNAANDLDAAVPAGSFANIQGQSAVQSTAGPEHSNRLMHYLICMANADGSSVLGVGDVIKDSNAADFDLTSLNLVGANAAGTEDAVDLAYVKVRHMTNDEYGQSGIAQGASTLVHDSSQTDVRKYLGFMATKSKVVGQDAGNQEWKRNTLSTSSNGFLYRAIPIEFAGTGLLTDWYDGGHLWKEVEVGTEYTLVLNNAGNAPATFTYTNDFGVDSTYVIFQSSQPLDGNPSTGTFPALVQV